MSSSHRHGKTHHIDLATITLDSGSAASKGDDHGCVMEWTARFAGLPVTDHPPCTSPVLTAFAIAFNDGVDAATRQRLVPFIPRLVGTAGDAAADERRVWMATDWLVRTFTPTWLRKAGLADEADALLALPELRTTALARSAQPIIDAASAKTRAVWAAARDAVWAAAGAVASQEKGYGAQYRAAREAAEPLFAQTIAELQDSVLSLFDRMIDAKENR